MTFIIQKCQQKLATSMKMSQNELKKDNNCKNNNNRNSNNHNYKRRHHFLWAPKQNALWLCYIFRGKSVKLPLLPTYLLQLLPPATVCKCLSLCLTAWQTGQIFMLAKPTRLMLTGQKLLNYFFRWSGVWKMFTRFSMHIKIKQRVYWLCKEIGTKFNKNSKFI